MNVHPFSVDRVRAFFADGKLSIFIMNFQLVGGDWNHGIL
jgi:hypothetical protein